MSETKVHELKTIPPFFEEVMAGTKTFELRKNDRGFRVGDVLILKEYFPDSKAYSGLETRRQITYVLRDFQGLETGYVILGIKPDENDIPF